MASKRDLEKWIVDALMSSGGTSTIVEVCKYVWEHHESDLRKSGDLFYTWGYDIRWARNNLAEKGVIDRNSPKGTWRLSG